MFPGRVVEKNGEAQLAGPAGDDGADVAHADDAQGEAIGAGDAALLHPCVDGGEDPLGDGGCVAARCVAHSDAVLVAVVKVDVVGADGRRADETHAAAIEQGGIAAGAGAHDERVGVAYGGFSELCGLEVIDRGKWLNQSTDVGNMALDNNSHDSYFIIVFLVHPHQVKPYDIPRAFLEKSCMSPHPLVCCSPLSQIQHIHD